MVKLFTEDVRSYANGYAGKICFTRIRDRLNELLTSVNGSIKHENYINHLIKILNVGLITATPSQFDAICDGFKPFGADMSKVFGTKKFYDLVVDAMGYDDARSIFRSYVPLMGIKTCVYCNAQYAVSFTVKNGKEYAQFEIDHWMPKSEYPYLSISFYNFVPCCPACNKHKSYQPLSFCLYSESPKGNTSEEYDPFVFCIPDKNLSRYIASLNPELLKIEFRSRFSDSLLEKDFDRFAINEMYELFRDEAALTIQRFLFYSEAYRKQLKSNYCMIFNSGGLSLEEFIYGIRLSQSNVLSRPLGKMTHDIREQLESSLLYFSWLIKKKLI